MPNLPPHLNTEIESHDGKSFGAYLAKASAPSAPVIIVIQEIFGVNVGLRAMCDAWAAKGYHALCPDMFWRQKAGVEISDKTPEEWEQAFGYFKGFDAEFGVKDLQSTLSAARSMAGSNGKVGTVGFCLGGMLAYLMASRSSAECNISYYGVNLPAYLNEAGTIKKPLLLHFAENDKYLSGDDLAKVRAALSTNPNIEGHVYDGMEHAFSRVNGQHFNAEAAALAAARSEAFFKKHLG